MGFIVEDKFQNLLWCFLPFGDSKSSLAIFGNDVFNSWTGLFLNL